MKKIRYRINEKGKKRIAAIGAVFMLLAILITLGQFVKYNNSLTETAYDSKKIGNAILKSIELNEKKVAEQATSNASGDKLIAVNPEVGDFFNQSLFIGDSRIQGLMIYSGVSAVGYSEKGLDVSSAASKPIIFYKGQKLTIPQALKLGQKFDKIIIKLGINELGWRSTNLFKEKYGELVGLVKEAQPKAKIYVHAILPVTAKKNASGTVYNNARIAEFNSIIKAITKEQGVYYIDVAPMLVDENGFIPESGAEADGVHFKSDMCKQWLVYIKRAILAL